MVFPATMQYMYLYDNRNPYAFYGGANRHRYMRCEYLHILEWLWLYCTYDNIDWSILPTVLGFSNCRWVQKHIVEVYWSRPAASLPWWDTNRSRWKSKMCTKGKHLQLIWMLRLCLFNRWNWKENSNSTSLSSVTDNVCGLSLVHVLIWGNVDTLQTRVGIETLLTSKTNKLI